MKNNSFIVGVFVIVAMILGVGAILILGAKNALSSKNKYVMFFEGDMTGLGPGAPVIFRGVKIGEVADIKILVDKKLNTSVPVFVELGSTKSENNNNHEDMTKVMKEYLNMGLCGKLVTESFVTGKLMIQLDFIKNKPKYSKPYKGDLIVIPTVSSDLELIKESLANLPIKSMIETLVSSLKGIDKRVNSTELTDSLKSLSASMKTLEQLLTHSDQEVVKLGARSDDALVQAQKLMVTMDKSLRELTRSLDKTLADVRKLSGSLDSKVNTIGDEVEKSTVSANKAIEEMRKTLAQYKNLIDPDSPIYIGMVNAIDNFSKASDSITAFTEYLNRHPESLIRGKKGE